MKIIIIYVKQNIVENEYRISFRSILVDSWGKDENLIFLIKIN